MDVVGSASLIDTSTDHLAWPKIFAGVYGDLALSSRMFRGSLVLALGLFAVCFPVSAQQPKHSGSAHHRLATSAVRPMEAGSNLSIYRPQILNLPSSSLLLHNGPVRAWSDGAQLVSESALVQIGMAPLGLFPVTYLAPSDIGPVPIRKLSTGSHSRRAKISVRGKEFPSQEMQSTLQTP